MSLSWARSSAGLAAVLLTVGALAGPPRSGIVSTHAASQVPLPRASEAVHRPPRPAFASTPTPTPALPSPARAVPAAQPRPLPPPPAPPRSLPGSGQQRLVNLDRAQAGLPPLAWNACLAAVALQNALRMAAQGYVSHANGVTLDLGCRLGSAAGENVGYLSSGINDVEMNALFMASPGHRANILGPYHYLGAAWAVAASGSAFIAVEFG